MKLGDLRLRRNAIVNEAPQIREPSRIQRGGARMGGAKQPNLLPASEEALGRRICWVI